MNQEKILLSCKTVELSETKTYLELLNRICFYDKPNYNGTCLPSADALERAQSLVDMPIKAKLTTNKKGEDTFGSHEAYVDEDGDIAFDTVPIGVHTEVYVAEDTVEINGTILTLPCLFAKQKIWTEKKNVVAATKRLYDEGRLYNSWEILYDTYEYSQGVKTLKDYTFTANVFLGNDIGVEPAYGHSATVLTLSTLQQSGERMIAEALALDLADTPRSNKESEDNILSKTKNIDQLVTPVVTTVAPELATDDNTVPHNEVATEGGDTNTVLDVITDESEVDESKKRKKCGSDTDSAALTDWDLRKNLYDVIRAKIGCEFWIAFHFPIDKSIWVQRYDNVSELDYVLFTYEVVDDVVTVSEPTPVKLCVSIPEINKVIAEKDETIVNMNAEISALTETIAKLEPLSAAMEAAEQKKREAEHAAQVAELQQYVIDSRAFTLGELDSDEIKTMVSELSKSELQAKIVDRLVSSYRTKTPRKVQASCTKPIHVKADVSDIESASFKDVMNEFFAK